MARRSHLFVITALLAGCQQITFSSDDGDDDDASDHWDPQTEGDPDQAEADEVDDEPESGDGDGETKLDMPGTGGLTECSLVDLLFVIDDSNSMIVEQDNLIDSFDGFIAGVEANLDEVNDYHIGVVTTDAYALNQTDCRTLGALVTESASGVCGPFAEGRYISLADELAPAFTCAANVGPGGDTNERQIGAALRAIGPELAGPGGCNEGFLRDDALLVLVLITDEDDPGSPMAEQGTEGDPSDWFADVVAIKGVETNVVVLALAGLPPPNACDDDVPFEGAQITDRIDDFVKKFSYGVLGDVCANDYSEFFANALELIAEACTNFSEE